jgi:hypothetical protein
MLDRSLSIPELILLVGTRVALGIGVGLLIGDKVNSDVRKGAGVALVTVGLLTTIPLAMDILSKQCVKDVGLPRDQTG